MASDRKNRWLGSLFGRGQETGPPALQARVSARSQLHQVRNPSSEVGPEPVHIPLTGCSVLVELVACGQETVVIDGIRAEVTDVAQIPFDGVAVTMSRPPDLNLAPDTDEAIRRSVANYRPLEPPHFEALLDQRPPVLRPARGSTQSPIVLPVRLAPTEQLSLFVAPITGDARLTSWDLIVDWSTGDRHHTLRSSLSVTGDTGYRVFHPDGRPPEPTSISTLARDHWTLVPDSCWGDLTRYAAAHLAGDRDAYFYELLGLMVLLPRSGGAPMVSRIEGGGLLWVFTTHQRLRGVAGVSYTAEVVPFGQVLEDVARLEMPFGVAVDPNTDVAVQLSPEAVLSLIEYRKSLVGRRSG